MVRKINRRDFAASFGTVTVGMWPLVAQAQQTKLPRIGILFLSNPEPFWSTLREALRELGYVDGKTIQFEFKLADGKPHLLQGLATELVRLRVDVIVANQTPAATAAARATTEIPIVIRAADPVGTGLVASLARPGGNITGMSATPPELGGKLLELTRELLPITRRVAVLANPSDPFTKPFLEQIERGSRILNLAIQTIMISGAGDLEAAFTSVANKHANAVIVQPSLPRKPVIDLALKHGLPAISPIGFFPREGGLMSYSADDDGVQRRLAVYVDRILKGTKPGDLPVELPTRFQLVVNLQTAKAIGLTIPETFLLRADELIE